MQYQGLGAGGGAQLKWSYVWDREGDERDMEGDERGFAGWKNWMAQEQRENQIQKLMNIGTKKEYSSILISLEQLPLP